MQQKSRQWAAECLKKKMERSPLQIILKKEILSESINCEEGGFNEMFIFGVRVEDVQIGEF